MVDAAIVRPDVVVVEEESFLHWKESHRRQHLLVFKQPSRKGKGVVRVARDARLTALEARDRGRDLDAASQEVWESGEGKGQDESQQGGARVDAGSASQGHGGGRGHGISQAIAQRWGG